MAVICGVVKLSLFGSCESCVADSAFCAGAVGGAMVARAVGAWKFGRVGVGWAGGGCGAGAADILGWAVDWVFGVAGYVEVVVVGLVARAEELVGVVGVARVSVLEGGYG